jgi:hypothetical protein
MLRLPLTIWKGYLSHKCHVTYGLQYAADLNSSGRSDLPTHEAELECPRATPDTTFQTTGSLVLVQELSYIPNKI